MSVCSIIEMLALISFLVFSPSAVAETGNAEPDQASAKEPAPDLNQNAGEDQGETGRASDWEFLVAPYLWMTGMSSTCS